MGVGEGLELGVYGGKDLSIAMADDGDCCTATGVEDGASIRELYCVVLS